MKSVFSFVFKEESFNLSFKILSYASLLLRIVSDNCFTYCFKSWLLGSCLNCGSMALILRTA
nr:MAG TPA: hypothetical protein [Crassvirales sp.]DAG93431.1 MAG TPA: hypothetical protein [Crassvirales sp.]DAU06320.1 MAG TPA: hypothetical protein [Caudoviricetes sp.]DAX21872.1 MAG TPA: hypothetical protein [Caudoviricetes sp.]